jgi:lipoprotein-releasing system ATP-binding protein
MNKTVLKGVEIYKSYKEGGERLSVLEGVNLEVKDKDIVVILGPSGSGKTTLIHILGGLTPPDSGKVIVDGINLVGLNDNILSKIRNQKIGFIFQFHQLLPEFTVCENIKIPSLITSLKFPNIQQKISSLLSYIGLPTRGDAFPMQLSGGERQRVSIVRALIMNPKIVLADEPSGNLDKENSEKLHKLFLKLNKEKGITFVITTHKEEMKKIGTKVFKLKDKKLHLVK